MKNVYEVLRQKELELARLEKEVEALRVAAPLLSDDKESMAGGHQQQTDISHSRHVHNNRSAFRRQQSMQARNRRVQQAGKTQPSAGRKPSAPWRPQFASHDRIPRMIGAHAPGCPLVTVG